MVKILKRVFMRHPDMTEIEVLNAWESRIKTQYRVTDEKPYLVAVGVSPKGRLIEMIAFEDGEDVVIFHAMKATSKLLAELGIL